MKFNMATATTLSIISISKSEIKFDSIGDGKTGPNTVKSFFGNGMSNQLLNTKSTCA